MILISKHNKDNDYNKKVVCMAWHEYQIYLTRISKHNKDNYYNNKVVGMVGLFLLLLLAGSAGAWIWSCRWIGISFFSSTIFPLCFLMKKKDPVHFEIQVWIVSGTGETSTLMSSWWRAGIFRATTIFNDCRQIWSCCPQLRQRVLSSWQHGSPDSSQGDLDTFAGLPSCHLIIMKTSHEDHIIIWLSGKGYKSKIIDHFVFTLPPLEDEGTNKPKK